MGKRVLLSDYRCYSDYRRHFRAKIEMKQLVFPLLIKLSSFLPQRSNLKFLNLVKPQII